MTASEEIKNSGLKATLPRMRILHLFQTAATRHMSAEDVYRKLLGKDREIGLATVYRVLMQFEQAGLLKRNQFEGGRAIFELNRGDHHDHLVCLDCGHVEEFFDAQIEDQQKHIAQRNGFDLADHALSLYAHCRKNPCPWRGDGAERTAPA